MYSNSWNASITAEVKNHMMQREEIEVIAHLENGPKDGITKINFEAIMPSGQVMNYCDENQYGLGDDAIAILTNDIMISGYELLETPFTINVYDEAWNCIGSFNDVATKWWD